MQVKKPSEAATPPKLVVNVMKKEQPVVPANVTKTSVIATPAA